MAAYVIPNSGIGAPLEQLLDDGLLVEGGGDVQGRVAVLMCCECHTGDMERN